MSGKTGKHLTANKKLVEITSRFIRQYSYIIKVLHEKHHLEILRGDIQPQGKQYIIYAKNKTQRTRQIKVMAPGQFLKAAQAAQRLLQTSWFG